MRITGKQLRQIIKEEIIRESRLSESSTGSGFEMSQERAANQWLARQNKMLTDMLTETYEWFRNTVFPAIETGDWPVVADRDYFVGTFSGEGLIDSALTRLDIDMMPKSITPRTEFLLVSKTSGGTFSGYSSIGQLIAKDWDPKDYPVNQGYEIPGLGKIGYTPGGTFMIRKGERWSGPMTISSLRGPSLRDLYKGLELYVSESELRAPMQSFPG